MYKHLEEVFPGREKQLEQLSNVTIGVSCHFIRKERRFPKQKVTM